MDVVMEMSLAEIYSQKIERVSLQYNVELEKERGELGFS
jgi:hypothetical protein